MQANCVRRGHVAAGLRGWVALCLMLAGLLLACTARAATPARVDATLLLPKSGAPVPAVVLVTRRSHCRTAPRYSRQFLRKASRPTLRPARR